MTGNPRRGGPTSAASRRWLLLLAVVVLVALFFLLDLPQRLSLEALRDAHAGLLAWRQRAPLSAAALYGLAYVLVTGLSLPGAAVMTLAGGAVLLLCAAGAVAVVAGRRGNAWGRLRSTAALGAAKAADLLPTNGPRQ